MSTSVQNGFGIYYELCGTGPPVLLIQGVGVTGEGWRPQIEGLAPRFQTLTFDHRGIGRSGPARQRLTIEEMARDARALMDDARWDSAHVVGHSMGGVVAQQLALDCPGRVRSLSLLCTFVRGRDAARLTPWVLWAGLRTRVGTRRMRRRAFLEMLFPPTYLAGRDLDDLAASVARVIGRDLAHQPPIVMRQLRALAGHDASARLGAVTAPTLVVSATHDRIAPPAQGRALAGSIAGARFEELPDASHGVTIQQADAINTRLLGFLTGQEPGRPARLPAG